jgi:hypothetical protein
MMSLVLAIRLRKFIFINSNSFLGPKLAYNALAHRDPIILEKAPI